MHMVHRHMVGTSTMAPSGGAHNHKRGVRERRASYGGMPCGAGGLHIGLHRCPCRPLWHVQTGFRAANG